MASETIGEEFNSTRPAFRWRQLLSLARVTASEYGLKAPGYEQACKLLMKPDLTLPDIALASGFSSQQHMTMAFRNRLGTTPKSFQRANSDG